MYSIKRLVFYIFLLTTVIFDKVCVYADAPDVKALGAVLMDKESGRVLWQHNGDAPLPMASTTKIMTAIMVLENAKLDTVITVPREATLAPKVKMYLTEGEKITVEQLLYALMLRSSNDAAIALAIGVGGDVQAFCSAMTEKAAALGCTDTVFETPNGLDKGNHHSTAHDMATIAAYALDCPELVRIMGTKSVTFSTNKKTYSLTNTDRFLSEYDGAIGIKTGFTGLAGHCFVGAAKRGSTTLITVVLGSGWGGAGKDRKWVDTKNLMNYGFENYSYKQLVNKGAEVAKVPVQNGISAFVTAVLSEDYGTAVKKGERFRLEYNVQKLVAPIKKGTAVGSAKIFVDSECVALIPLTAAENVGAQGFWYKFKILFGAWTSVASA